MIPQLLPPLFLVQKILGDRRSHFRGTLHRRVRFRGVSLAAAFLTAASVAAPSLRAESWTDLRGTRTIEADFVGLFGEQVVLRLTDGRKVAVKLDQLRAESRIQAKDLSEQRASRRADRVAELNRQAKVAAAAAPQPLPQPDPAPEYERPAEGMSALETVQYLDRQVLQGGHVLALYDSLPVEYRDLLDQLLAQVSLKLDQAMWDGVTGAAHEIGDLIVTHQNWIFSHPRLKALSGDDAEALREVVLAWAGLLRSGFDPEVVGLKDLQTMPLRDWIARWDQATSPYLASLSRQHTGPSTQYEQTGERGGVVTIEAKQGEQSISFEMKQVGDHWTFAALADQFPKFVEESQLALDETPDGSIDLGGVASMLPTIIQSQSQPLRQASSAAEFHAALDAMASSVTPDPEVVASMLPESFRIPGMGLGSAPGASPYSGEYDGATEYDGAMEEDMYEEMNDDIDYGQGYNPDAGQP